MAARSATGHPRVAGATTSPGASGAPTSASAPPPPLRAQRAGDGGGGRGRRRGERGGAPRGGRAGAERGSPSLCSPLPLLLHPRTRSPTRGPTDPGPAEDAGRARPEEGCRERGAAVWGAGAQGSRRGGVGRGRGWERGGPQDPTGLR